MQKLTRSDLLSLEQYSQQRKEFRANIMAHKKNRVLKVGPHATLHFEDRLTMQYQVQEMLRAEKMFESAGIQEELDAYNPLIPDGSNWKATFMIEYGDVEERREALAQLIGIEQKVWVKVGGGEPVWAIADEDLERETEEKTSSVHFLRFELPPAQAAAAKAGQPISVGIEHSKYSHACDPVADAMRASLAADLS
jgi:hypothetical protein